jgi:hypothetical protein
MCCDTTNSHMPSAWALSCAEVGAPSVRRHVPLLAGERLGLDCFHPPDAHECTPLWIHRQLSCQTTCPILILLLPIRLDFCAFLRSPSNIPLPARLPCPSRWQEKAGKWDCAGNHIFLEAAQKGFATRPQAKKSPEAYPLGYVEDGCETRTTHGKRLVSASRGWAGEKEAFFSSL